MGWGSNTEEGLLNRDDWIEGYRVARAQATMVLRRYVKFAHRAATVVGPIGACSVLSVDLFRHHRGTAGRRT